MQLQAETYNISIQEVAVILSTWKEDAAKYQEKITETAQQGGKVAGMEIYYQKQMDKISAFEKFASTAHQYIQGLESELHQLRVSNITNTTIARTPERVRICDLPAGPVNDHLETMELLYEILERLPKPQTQSNG